MMTERHASSNIGLFESVLENNDFELEDISASKARQSIQMKNMAMSLDFH
jgi:hypothetical protein